MKESLSQDDLNDILDKISKFGIDSLSQHEKILLKSFSDESIDVKDEIQKHINRYKTAKNVIEQVPLRVNDSELEKDIGRYIKFKYDKDNGLFANMGMVYEIVAIQKHWGYIDGKYVPHKIGYRIAEVGKENDFGRVGDVDKVEFVNITEQEAIDINKEIHEKLS